MISLKYEGCKKTTFANKDLFGLPETFYVEKEMGEKLG